jgi:hypothetical protein
MIMVLVLTATAAFFLVYVEVKSRRNPANKQSSTPETVDQTSTATTDRK